MIIDFHTHVFPPSVIEQRETYLREDATFAELYGTPKAKLATAEELLNSMDAGGIDVSVALGFAWMDVETCKRHNDYLLEAGASSGGRIIPFCTLPLAADAGTIETEARRCLVAGARGFGELRPDNLHFELRGEGGAILGRLADELGAVLLFHASEPVGHSYPGKQGLTLGALYEFILQHPDTKTVAAHWGGGLPFYALMPEVRLALKNACFDTAGTSLLYNPDIYLGVVDLLGPQSILFGSDFPLLSQARSRRRIEEAELDAEAKALLLGGNARRLLNLE